MAKFYGIGVGPGDPELLTMKAVKVLSQIDVVVLPEAKKNTNSIAYDIAKQYIHAEAEKIYLEFPMVTDAKVIEQAGKKAAEVIEERVAEGKNTAFITLGDPCIYSTYGYILKQLKKEIDVETIPGITSFCASAAATNTPLVEGKEILSIIPSTSSSNQIKQVMDGSDSFAFMKVYSQKDKITEILNEHELLQNSVLVKRCGFEDCTIETDVMTALEQEKQYLSIILSKKGR